MEVTVQEDFGAPPAPPEALAGNQTQLDNLPPWRYHDNRKKSAWPVKYAFEKGSNQEGFSWKSMLKESAFSPAAATLPA